MEILDFWVNIAPPPKKNKKKRLTLYSTQLVSAIKVRFEGCSATFICRFFCLLWCLRYTKFCS